MPWLRFDDDWNQQPEIRALDDASYRAFICMIEAAENFDACGLVPDHFAMAVYPHARQKLRDKPGKPGKLAQQGLVHLLSDPEERDHDCPACQTRWEELGGEGAEELRKKLGTSSATSTQSRKTDPIYICIRDFFEVAMTPAKKRQTKQGNAKRQRKKRQEDRAEASRRDAEPPSHPSVPVPVPGDIDIYPMLPKEDPAPALTASPSEPSDLVEWLREELTDRRKHIGCQQPKWKDEHQEQLEAVVLKANKAPGDTFKLLNGALDGFFADPTQLKYRHSPAGLAHGFDKYAAPILEQEKAEASAHKIAEKDAEYERIRDEYAERDWRQKQAQKQEREQNGTSRSSTPGGNLGTDLQEWK